MSFVPIVVNIINQKYRQIRAYIARVARDGGLIRNQSISQQYYQLIKQNNIPQPVFSWVGEAGTKPRVSGIYSFATKLYSMFGTNDATQTTSTSQPYLSGNIAPNEKLCLKNPNGDIRNMTHPTISFASNEAWSVTTVFNLPYLAVAANIYNNLFGKAADTGFRLTYDNKLQYNNNVTIATTTKNISDKIGKNIVLNIVANGNNIIYFYLNGVFFEQISIASNLNSDSILKGRNIENAASISSHIITPAALTPSQVATQYNFLRSLYPEIPSVTIGSQTWATSNCEMVVTPQGNLIANVTENVNVEKAVGGNFESGLYGTFQNELGGAIASYALNTTLPISGINDGKIEVTTVGTAATRPRLLNSLNPTLDVNKYYKVSFSYKINSGTVKVAIYKGSTNTSQATLIDSGVFSLYAKPEVPNNYFGAIVFDGTNLFNVQIDNISIQEIGWAGSTELYDGIYAQTVGTVEQKTTAALRAASFWRYPSNDIALGSVYGKKLNKYALKLLAEDIAAYNTANPTALWGYDVPTEADLEALQTSVNNNAEALKHGGTTYWNAPNAGTNSSGFTSLPSGYIDVDGTTRGLNTTDLYVGVDNTELDDRLGTSLRLIKR